jgi:hypothetical protein
MMINRKTTFFLGIFIFIIPFLGFPSFWKELLTAVSGIFLILLSIRIAIPKKYPRHRTVREKVTPVFVESAPIIYPKNDTIEVISHVEEAKTVEVKPHVRKSRLTNKKNGPVI